MNDIIIRDFTDQDFSQIAKLLFDFQKQIGKIAGSFGKRAFASMTDADTYLKQALKDVEDMKGFFYVAESEKELVGFIYGVVLTNEGNLFHELTHIPETEGWIGIIYVPDNFRQHGVGARLMKAAGDYLKKVGCESVKLVVDSSNQKAVDYYSKLGFVEYEKKMQLNLIKTVFF